MRSKHRGRTTSLVLPASLVQKLDKLKEHTELNRSEVASELLKDNIDNEQVLDRIFGQDQKED